MLHTCGSPNTQYLMKEEELHRKGGQKEMVFGMLYYEQIIKSGTRFVLSTEIAQQRFVFMALRKVGYAIKIMSDKFL